MARIILRTFPVCAVMTSLLGLGCPGEVEHRYGVSSRDKRAELRLDDRGVNDGPVNPVELVEPTQPEDSPEEPTPALGSGKPDESNGECRLYAPQLPLPQCCKPEFGFDAELTRQACGLPLYLGESWQSSCGYYFHKPGGRPIWFRASFISGTTAKKAAQSQARQLRGKAGATDLEIQTFPGVKDAFWMTYDGLAWAYFGGWPEVRQFAWRTDTCSQSGIAKVIAAMQASKVPPKGAKRLALVPKARQ